MNSASAASPALPLALPALIRRPLAIVLGSLLVAVCAHISIPLWFTPVPVTLQTFAVLLLGLFLSPSLSAPAGFLHLLGPTGGYLLSWPFAAALTGLLRSRFSSRGFAPSLLAAAAGSLLILLCGASWFGILTHQSAGAVLVLAVLPFLPGDILKVVAAAGAASGLSRFEILTRRSLTGSAVSPGFGLAAAPRLLPHPLTAPSPSSGHTLRRASSVPSVACVCRSHPPRPPPHRKRKFAPRVNSAGAWRTSDLRNDSP